MDSQSVHRPLVIDVRSRLAGRRSGLDDPKDTGARSVSKIGSLPRPLPGVSSMSAWSAET